MTIKNLLAVLFLGLSLAGCSSQRASYGETFSDNFLFTSARNVPEKEMKCFRLKNSYSFTIASDLALKLEKFNSKPQTYVLPAGLYQGKQKVSSGVFYTAPHVIQAHSILHSEIDGVYINNAGTAGNLNSYKENSVFHTPMRGVKLPSSFFKNIQKGC